MDYTIKNFADEVDKSYQFVRAAIALKKLKAKKYGNMWLIPGSEEKRFKENPFQISRKEMAEL